MDYCPGLHLSHFYAPGIEGVIRYIQGQKGTLSMNSIITKQTLEGNMLELLELGEIRGPPEEMKEFEDMFNSG